MVVKSGFNASFLHYGKLVFLKDMIFMCQPSTPVIVSTDQHQDLPPPPPPTHTYHVYELCHVGYESPQTGRIDRATVK